MEVGDHQEEKMKGRGGPTKNISQFLVKPQVQFIPPNYRIVLTVAWQCNSGTF